MNNKQLVASFAEFAKSRNIDRPTVIKILEEVFRAMIHKKFGVVDNFDLVINLDEGDLQIWRFREVVADDADNVQEDDKIGLSEARQLEADFEVGEEVTDEITLSNFGRRAIGVARQTLLQRVKDLERDALYKKYAQRVGQLISAEVYHTLPREVILLDEEKNELILPKSEQIPRDRFRKGDHIYAIVHKVSLQETRSNVLLSRASPVFLERLLENEVPEVSEGLITIKKIVREPGVRAKVVVESYDDRVDPVGACVGMKGSRIHSIVRELGNENIDVINFTNNDQLYITRALSPAKITSIKLDEENKTAEVMLKPEEVSKAMFQNYAN